MREILCLEGMGTGPSKTMALEKFHQISQALQFLSFSYYVHLADSIFLGVWGGKSVLES